jgi:hypothetical protein
MKVLFDLTTAVAAVSLQVRQQFFSRFDLRLRVFAFFEQCVVHSSDERNMEPDEDSEGPYK